MKQSPAPLALLFTASLLVALLAWQWSTEARWQPGPAMALDPNLLGPAGKGSDEAEPTVPDASQIIARPLFSPNRTPLARGTSDAQPVLLGHSSITLLGVFQAEHAAGALLSIDGRLVRLGLGASANGLRLEAVHDEAVLLVDTDGGRTEYRLTRLPRHVLPTEVGGDADDETSPDEFPDD